MRRGTCPLVGREACTGRFPDNMRPSAPTAGRCARRRRLFDNGCAASRVNSAVTGRCLVRAAAPCRRSWTQPPQGARRARPSPASGRCPRRRRCRRGGRRGRGRSAAWPGRPAALSLAAGPQPQRTAGRRRDRRSASCPSLTAGVRCRGARAARGRAQSSSASAVSLLLFSLADTPARSTQADATSARGSRLHRRGLGRDAELGTRHAPAARGAEVRQTC